MKIQIHNYSTAKGGQRIGKYRFKETMRNIKDIDFISDNTEQAAYTHEDISQILVINGVGLHYSYSPGLGSFPNEREEIQAFGQFNEISKLCEKLREKGLPVKSITLETK